MLPGSDRLQNFQNVPIYIYISTYVFLSFNIEQFPPILALPQDLRLSLILALYLAVTATGAVALRLRGAAPALLLGLGLIVAPWRIRYERCGFSGASGWGEAAHCGLPFNHAMALRHRTQLLSLWMGWSHLGF